MANNTFKKLSSSDDLALSMQNILSGQVSKDNDSELEKSSLKNELIESINMLEDFNVKASDILKNVLKNISG